jgi:hypothetical protein
MISKDYLKTFNLSVVLMILSIAITIIIYFIKPERFTVGGQQSSDGTTHTPSLKLLCNPLASSGPRACRYDQLRNLLMTCADPRFSTDFRLTQTAREFLAQQEQQLSPPRLDFYWSGMDFLFEDPEEASAPTFRRR